VKRPLGIALVLMLLVGCSAGGGTSGSPSPAPSPSATEPTASASPSASGPAPSAEQVSWAGDVCTDTTTVQTDLQGLALAATTGGADALTAVSDQMAQVSESAGTLIDTVRAAPSGSSDDPAYSAVRSSIDGVDQSLQALQASVTQVQGATGAALATALASVVVDAGTVLTDVAATARAITSAMQDRSSTVGQAFRAAPECTALTSQ
jgi:hypothetical protein